MATLSFWFSSKQQFKKSRYLNTVLKRYEIKYNVKYINSSFLTYLENNIVIIPISGDLIEFSENNLEKCLSTIEWGVNNNIKILFDYSWEQVPSPLNSWTIKNKIINGNLTHIPKSEARESKLYHLLPTFKEKNIKFLANKSENPEYIFQYANNKKYNIVDNLIIDSDTFPYELRSSRASTKDKYHLNTFPVNHKDKKYLFLLLGGDVRRKFGHALLFAGLHYENLLDDNFWTITKGSFWDKPIDKYANALDINDDMSWLKKVSPSYFLHLIKNHDKIIIPKTFDTYYRDRKGEFLNTPGSDEERRIPQEMYDSHFNLVLETIMRETFYTEKTYKPIMVGMPFLIFGSPMQNQYLKTRGYEIFPEIFDYSFEEILPDHRQNLNKIKYTSLFIDEIKRINKEPRSIFNQKIVKEKVEYNKNLFFKKTTKASLQEHLIKIFIEEWE